MPILLQKKYEYNDINLAVWQITESHDELQALLPSEILTDAVDGLPISALQRYGEVTLMMRESVGPPPSK